MDRPLPGRPRATGPSAHAGEVDPGGQDTATTLKISGSLAVAPYFMYHSRLHLTENATIEHFSVDVLESLFKKARISRSTAIFISKLGLQFWIHVLSHRLDVRSASITEGQDKVAPSQAR